MDHLGNAMTTTHLWIIQCQRQQPIHRIQCRRLKNTHIVFSVCSIRYVQCFVVLCFVLLCFVVVVVRRAGLLWSQQDFEWLWSVPLSSASLYWEFSFILFDLCLFMTIFNFILNYVPTVTFWIFTYHKIWILLIIFCFIWSYWIIYFLTCLEVFWSVVS